VCADAAIATTTIEATTIRKLRTHIIPFVFVLFVINFVDRINIGFAALTMNKELAITSQQFGLLSGIFFWGYFIFEIPSNLLLHKLGARIWIARILVSWGIVASLTGFARTAIQTRLDLYTEEDLDEMIAAQEKFLDAVGFDRETVQ